MEALALTKDEKNEVERAAYHKTKTFVHPVYVETMDSAIIDASRSLIHSKSSERFESALVARENKIFYDSDVRNCKVRTLGRTRLKNLIAERAKAINSKNWQFKAPFEVSNLIQLKYQKGEYFKWHRDCSFDHQSNHFNRVLTAIVMLSDRKDYRGGELEIRDWLGSVEKPIFSKFGSLIVFPSVYFHQVKKVIGGERQSLVLWLMEK